MSKSEVYSWRLDPDLKRRLEDAARKENTSVGGLLDRIARDWLGRHASEEDEEALQRRCMPRPQGPSARSREMIRAGPSV